ncbi:MAG: hypothetical protein A2Z96_07285 [Spirochaetes bacterium GWB1_48_6]|nr:MAG: hypothetical protein A2Z96_07285 [Spirochaetes bacterium GWB1_48_6]
MIFEEVRKVLESSSHRKRPGVTLSWAQSLNGVIAAKKGEKTLLSDNPSLEVLHGLRSLHQGLMVGIGTILADDPQLNVRLVPGPSPIPIILDTKLRIPLDAKVLHRTDAKPWIFYTEGSEEKKKKLQDLDAWLFQVSWGPAGVDLKAVLEILKMEAMNSLMVEGGSSVISSFLREKFSDQAVITLCPLIMDGLGLPDFTHFPHTKHSFTKTLVESAGKDQIYWGQWGS